MALIDDDWSDPPPECQDCGEPMDGKSREHSVEGFGHYRRCCVCYDRRQRGVPTDKPWRP